MDTTHWLIRLANMTVNYYKRQFLTYDRMAYTSG